MVSSAPQPPLDAVYSAPGRQQRYTPAARRISNPPPPAPPETVPHLRLIPVNEKVGVQNTAAGSLPLPTTSGCRRDEPLEICYSFKPVWLHKLPPSRPGRKTPHKVGYARGALPFGDHKTSQYK